MNLRDVMSERALAYRNVGPRGVAGTLARYVLTGTWGVLVQPRFFDASFADYSRADGASFFVDDIWTSGHLARRGLERRVAPASRPPVSTLACRNALSRGENRDGRHNDAMLGAVATAWGRPAC